MHLTATVSEWSSNSWSSHGCTTTIFYRLTLSVNSTVILEKDYTSKEEANAVALLINLAQP